MRKHLLAVSLAMVAAASGCDKARPIAAPDAGVTACIGCHGGLEGDTRGAPPRGLDPADPNSPATRAHRPHLAESVRCEDCHVVPTRVSDLGHLTLAADLPTGEKAGDPDPDGHADVPFPTGSRARLGGMVPSYDRASGTCSNVYCHGAKLAAPPPPPTWTGGPMTCGSCHGNPPAGHNPDFDPTRCVDCHPATVDVGGGIVAGGGGHINGVVDVDATKACTTCHGDGERVEPDAFNKAAPPVGVANSANAGATGAHLAHLHDGTLSKAFACSSCHLVPADFQHFDAPPAAVRAEMAFDTNDDPAKNLATRDGASPAWSTVNGTCSGVYCHGATLSGGSNKTPLWTGGPGQVGGTGTTLVQRCGVCHGAPPALPHPAVDQGGAAFTQIGQCAGCHPGTVDATGEILADGGLHVNGLVDVDNVHPANFAQAAVHGPQANANLGACKTCHGANFDTQVGNPPFTCTTCHTAAGHPNWLTECTFCHGDGARASVGTFASAGNPAATLDKIAPPQGTQNEATASQVAVGAHLAHLGQSGLSPEIQCTECHGASLPSDTNHANASVALGWGTLATHAGTSTPVVPTPTGTTFTAAWENNPNCTNYCHGATLAGGRVAPPSWVEGPSGATCGTCHAMRPGTWHPDNSACDTCHGAGYVALGGVFRDTHVNGAVNLVAASAPLSCTSCHGTEGRAGVTGADANQAAAPPRASNGNTSGTKVGAHLAHVNAATLRGAPLACADCHVVPAAGAFRHGNNGVDVAWSTLARADGAAMAPAAGTLPGSWESTPTCTNYCHGNTLGGGGRTAPNWGDTAATAAACNSCHGAPPPYALVGSFHVENAACGGCHAGATATSLTAAARATHINGTINVSPALGCNTCHSTGTPFAAPFRATTGITDPADTRVGAHARHLVADTFAGPLACADCHGVQPGSPRHADGNVDVGWSSIATAGGTFAATPAGPIATSTPVSCANYCHGATLPGGSVASPSWTGGAAQAACGTCHFTEANEPATHPAVAARSACITCHPDTVTAAGTINVAGGRHINGIVDQIGASHVIPFPAAQHSVQFEASPANCTACHGANYDTLVGTPAKSCNTCHAGLPIFGYTGVANAQWSTDCTFCHGDPATVKRTDAAYASVGTPARSLVAVAPPESLTDGVISNTVVRVGAHLGHFTTTIAVKVQCTACHGTMPANLTHMDGSVALGWSTLATAGGTVVPAPAAFTPVWEGPAERTCTNYCHGATLAGGLNTTPTWTSGPGETLCGSCHATPAPYTAAGNWHVENSACGSCHAGYTLATTNAAVHVNGVTNVGTMTCLTCHALVAPFRATTGATAASDPRVGAHDAHVTAGPMAAALACTDCHGPTPGVVLHASGAVNLTWTTLATANGTVAVSPAGPTVVTGSAVSCANYCHGATLPGGSVPNPSWTGGAAQAACGTCHFTEANEPATHPAVAARTECATCHPGTVTAAGAIDLAGGRHVNGTVEATGTSHAIPFPALQHSAQFEANPGACTGCHGTNFDTLVGAVPKSCNTCHAGLPIFGYTGTANAQWSTDCTFCHGDPATVKRSDAAYASVGTPARSLVAVAPPEALTDGVVAGTAVRVGAHLTHYSTTTSSKVQCTACHGAMPATLAHMNGAVGLGWSTLATLNGAVTPTPAAFNGAWESPTPSCTNYCHGATLTGGSQTSPRWTVAADGNCGACHFVAAATAAGVHASHVNQAAVLGANYQCADCHASVVNAAGALVGGALHVNGAEEVAMAARGTQSNGSYSVAAGCTASYCHSSGQATPSYRAVTWTVQNLGCSGCHGAGTFGAPSYVSGGAGTATANSHASHTASGADGTTCSDCHFNLVNAAGNAIVGTSHTNGTRNVAFNTLVAGATAAYAPATKTCSNVACHGTATPSWGAGAAAVTCKSCHATTGAELEDLGAAFWDNGIVSTINSTAWAYSGHGRTTGTFDVTANPAPAFSTTVAGTTECLYCHDDGVGHRSATNPFRLRGASATGGATGAWGTGDPNATCNNCHRTGGFGVDPDGASAAALRTGTTKSETAHDGSKHTVGTLGGKFCWDCHDPHGDRSSNNTNAGENIAMIRSAVFAVTEGTYGYLGASGQTRPVTYNVQTAGAPGAGRSVETTTAAGTQHIGLCQACHAASSDSPVPATAWTKYWDRLGRDDSDGPGGAAPIPSAHNASSATTPYCVSCHSHDSRFAGAGGDCTGCHLTPQGPRRAIVPEFGQAWSHKRSAGGAVTKFDCIVCHMEGDPVTGDVVEPTYHQNGVINLRDPDLGGNIKGVSFVTASGSSAGSYVATTADATFTQFRRNLSSNVLEASATAIMINQCLKCHDANGANDPTGRVSTGTAFKPFGTTIAGAGYSGTLTAAGTVGGVTNINASFATTNASYHPVRGAGNNWYARLTRMIAPWDGARTGTTANTASWGLRITCWDCHAPTGATGLQTRSVTAHGGSVTVRGTTWNNTSTLCKTCHAVNTTGAGHGAGSAFTAASGYDTGMDTYLRNQCHYCHASGITAPVRPLKAEDVHGFDRFGYYLGSDSWWPVGATNTYRPFAFMRNVGSGASGSATNPYNSRWTNTSWKPLSGPGVGTGSATCGGNMSASSCSNGMDPYTPGGVF